MLKQIISDKISKVIYMKIGIYGYGNLGKGVESAILNSSDATLFGVFTRRDPDTITLKDNNAKVLSADSVLDYKNDIDVMIICGGSATDLPEMTPFLSEHFNVIDSFDTHAKIPTHFENVDKKAKAGKKTAVISVGWDPGMFSLARLYSLSILKNGKSNTFWGKGISQGHSDAIRRIDGVIDARQYTVPVESTLEKVRNGAEEEFSARQKHTRLCYVVADEKADKAKIEKQIKEMPNYFADYDTTVNFISLEELKANHSAMPHGGRVITTGKTGIDKINNHTVEYSLTLDSNPEFTASVLLATARAALKMNSEGDFGCKTLFDIPPKYFSEKPYEDLIKELL